MNNAKSLGISSLQGTNTQGEEISQKGGTNCGVENQGKTLKVEVTKREEG